MSVSEPDIDELAKFCDAQAIIRDEWVRHGKDDEQRIAGHLHGGWFRQIASALRSLSAAKERLAKIENAAKDLLDCWDQLGEIPDSVEADFRAALGASP